MDAVPDGGLVDFLFVGGDVGFFGDVGIAAEADVAVHAFHLVFFDVGDEFPLGEGGGEFEGAVDLIGFEHDQRAAAGLGADAD